MPGPSHNRTGGEAGGSQAPPKLGISTEGEANGELVRVFRVVDDQGSSNSAGDKALILEFHAHEEGTRECPMCASTLVGPHPPSRTTRVRLASRIDGAMTCRTFIMGNFSYTRARSASLGRVRCSPCPKYQDITTIELVGETGKKNGARDKTVLHHYRCTSHLLSYP